MVRASFAALVGIVLLAEPGEAQHCAGAAPFASSRFRIGAVGERRDDRARLTGALAIGGRRKFAEVSAGIGTYDAFDTPSTLVGLAAGLEREMGRGVRACPRASVLAGIGPRDIAGGDVDASTLDGQLGVDVGRAFALARHVQLVPFAGAALRWARLTLDSPSSGESFRRTDTYGTIDGGVGAIIARRVSIVPRVSTSVGALDAGSSVSLSIAIGVGGGE